MPFLRAIPLLILPALLYAAVALTLEPTAVRESLNQVFFNTYLPSGALFAVTNGYGIVMLAAFLLFLEISSSRHRRRAGPWWRTA